MGVRQHSLADNNLPTSSASGELMTVTIFAEQWLDISPSSGPQASTGKMTPLPLFPAWLEGKLTCLDKFSILWSSCLLSPASSRVRTQLREPGCSQWHHGGTPRPPRGMPPPRHHEHSTSLLCLGEIPHRNSGWDWLNHNVCPVKCFTMN